LTWFEGNEGGVSTAVLIYKDMVPGDHDGKVTINEKLSDPNSKINTYLQFARLEINQNIVVDINKTSGGELHIVGANNTEIKTKNNDTYSKGVDVDVLDKKDRYNITFEKPARGGYSIQWGPGDSWQWSDPVFVQVGQPKEFRESFSYLDRLAMGKLSLEGYNEILNSTLPENVGYNFYLMDSDGDLVVNADGEVLEVWSGVPSSDAVSSERVIVASNSTKESEVKDYEVYRARLVLWYR
ncbi:MAG: putative pilin/flagellin, partial [Candidatus Methanohalarchaeum thermophilum]